MDLLQVVCVLLSLVSTCTGKAFTFGSRMHFTGPDPIETVPQCLYDNKPCMILVRSYNDNGTISAEFRSNAMCTCGDDVTCPSQWDRDQARTITRYLRTQVKVMELQLKFCHPVQNERVCQPHEVALTMQGISVMPQEVTSVTCRCSENRPLYLRRFWFTSYIRHQDFVCQMPDCVTADDVPCMMTNRSTPERETNIICKCPGNKQCRPSPHIFESGNQYVLGRCSP